MDDFIDDLFDDGFSDGQEEGYALFGAFTDKSYGGEPDDNSTANCCGGCFIIMIFLILLGVACS